MRSFLLLASVMSVLYGCHSTTSTPVENSGDDQLLFQESPKPVENTTKPTVRTVRVKTSTTINIEKSVEVAGLSEKAQALKLSIDKNLASEEIKPGYPNAYGIQVLGLAKRGGVQKGTEWSHRFVALVAREMGQDEEIILSEERGSRQIEYTTPYEMSQHILDGAISSYKDIVEVSLFDATSRANRGEAVIFVASVSKNQNKAMLGIVYPDEDEYRANPQLAMVAPQVGLVSLRDLYAQIKEVPRFFVLPKKEGKTLAIVKASGQKLNQKIQEVISREEYQPGYPSWDGLYKLGLPAKRGAEPGTTWCQAAAFTIVNELGLLTHPLVGDSPITWVNADQVYANLNRAAPDFASGVKRIDPEEAQVLANKGEVVVVVAHSTGQDLSGHVGIVAMTDRVYNPRIGPFIGQAGAVNGYFNYRTWIVDWKMEPILFHLTKKAK